MPGQRSTPLNAGMVHRRLHSQWRTIRYGEGTVLSAYTPMELGALTYLLKPFDCREVMDLVQGAISRGRPAWSSSREYVPINVHPDLPVE